jgi:hypothetical protein
MPQAEDVGVGNPPISHSRKAGIIFTGFSTVLFAAFALQLVLHAIRTSTTVDEPVHILAGHRHWQCGDFGINPEHPPLLKLLATTPLNFRRLAEPPWECGSKLTSKFDSFSYGNTFLVENGVDSIVIPTRLASAIMSLLLAVLVFLAAWEMFGRWEALTALAILAFEPNLIAHGSIVTTDMALSATAFGAVYALYRYGKHQTLLRFLVAGFALGLLLAAKHSAVIFVGILFVLLIADTLLFQGNETRLPLRLFRQIAAFVGIFLIGLAILWSFYGFRCYAIASSTESTISIADYIKENGRPESITSFPARVTGAISGSRIFPESYVLGMADVIAWGSRNTWIFGRTYATGQWFYFPLAFVVESSIALLLLLPLGLIYSYFNPVKWREAMFLLAPAVAFFVIASNSNFTNGIRHILPIYALLIVLAAAGGVWLGRKFRLFQYFLVVLLIYHVAVAFRTAPNYKAFANDFWGGYENTQRIFRDSNVDTGQSIKLVNEYLQRENIKDCWIAAPVHPELIAAIQPCRPMPSMMTRILVSRNVIDEVSPVIEGTVVLSVNELPPRGGDEYVPIAQSEPIAFIGGNMYVYRGRFEVPLAAAISRVQRSGQFLRMNRGEEAVAEGREAVRLGPEDPRTHLALGLALVRAEQEEEARRELETAVGQAKADPRFRNAEVRAQQEIERLDGN